MERKAQKRTATERPTFAVLVLPVALLLNSVPYAALFVPTAVGAAVIGTRSRCVWPSTSFVLQ